VPRPTLSDANKRSHRISINWRPGEYERVSQAAEALGLDLSGFLRMAAIKECAETESRTRSLGLGGRREI